MIVYIKTSQDGIPETETEYAALQGFQDLGCKTVFFNSEAELSDWRPDRLIVAGKTIIRNKLLTYDIEVEDYDYPDELKSFLGRNIWVDTFDNVLSSTQIWPIFVKPIRNKAFTGFVLRNETDVPRLRNTKNNEPVLCSELVDFVSEYRAFVRYGNICDVRPYKGDWHVHFDSDVLDNAVLSFKSIPAGCALDFGVTKDGRTLLIEVNDGFALGSYGIDPIEYAKLLSARWSELVGIHDECDIYHEGVNWRDNR